MRTRCTFTVGAGFCSCVSDSVSAGIGQGCCGTQNGRIEMKKMKKFAALFLSAALVTACVACGNDAGTGESGSSSVEESSSESSEESSEASDAGSAGIWAV